MSTVNFTIDQVVALLSSGLSQREVARKLGRESQESTIRDMLRRELLSRDLDSVEDLLRQYSPGEYEEWAALQENGSNTNPDYRKAKILILDIETAPLKAHLWSMWQHGVGLNQIESDWYMLSFAAKWAHEDNVTYMDIRETYDKESDASLLPTLWGLLDDADFVIGHNIKKFDMKKINARFILNGMGKPSTYRCIDTLLIAKSLFGFTSNKLEYLTEKLCKVYKKSTHKKFPGHKLWVECLKGNLEAWEEMEDYNKFDILSNQELYEIFMPWDAKLPNFDLYMDDIVDMSAWVPDGYHYTNLGKYQKYRHKVTGQQRRGRTNLLSKEKRDSLLANIVS